MNQVTELLQQVRFPEKLERFARRFSRMEEVWANCPRADWMLWLLGTFHLENRKALRLFILRCAKRWTHFLSDQRSLRALSVAEQIVNNPISRSAIEFIRESADKAALDAASGTKPITARAARLVALALQDNLLEAAKEASHIASQAEHAINDTMSEEHEAIILHEQANDLRDLFENPFSGSGMQSAQYRSADSGNPGIA